MLLTVTLLASSGLTAQDLAKSYRLFVGVDLKLKGEGTADGAETYRRVDALKPNQVVLDEPGSPTVPLNRAGAFSWARTPRVSRTPVTIADFEQHRTFTLRNDRSIQYMATQNDMVLYQQEKVDAARMEAGFSDRMRMVATGVWSGIEQAEQNGTVVDAMTKGMAEANLAKWNEQSTADFAAMTDQMSQTDAIISDPTLVDRALAATGEGGEDVMELSFLLSSPVPIADAYVVVMGAIKQDGDKEGVVVFHQPVGTIGPEPRKIKVRKTGFKPGFTITDVKLHVYSHGKELGTNLSEKAVPLTRDQAREYLLLSHVSQHRFDTLPPAPVWELVPPAVLANADRKTFDYPVVVNIDADGSIISLHDDEKSAKEFLNEIEDSAALRTRTTREKAAASLGDSVRLAQADDTVAFDQTGHLPPRIVAAIRDMIFLPAINLGQPQPGTTRVNLADFYR